jgi:type IV secretory pathway TraG/TraD family ATPase VirD4
VGSQLRTHQLVTAGEVMKLENLKCYVKLLGDYPIVLLSLQLQPKTLSAGGFQARTEQNPEVWATQFIPEDSASGIRNGDELEIEGN